MPSHLNSFRSSGDLNTRRNALPASSHRAKKRRLARLALWMPFLLCLSGAFVMKGAAAPNESLPFATSYTVTGDYVVGGVDLLPQQAVNGFVQGEIPIAGVPANAEHRGCVPAVGDDRTRDPDRQWALWALNSAAMTSPSSGRIRSLRPTSRRRSRRAGPLAVLITRWRCTVPMSSSFCRRNPTPMAARLENGW